MRTDTRAAPCRLFRHGGPALTTALAALSATAGAVLPSTPGDDVFHDLPALATDELQALRGGFEFAGLKFDFAAQLRTFVDGRLALETLITYTDSGMASQQQPTLSPGIATQPSAATPPAGAGQPAETPPATSVTAPGITESVQLLGPEQDQTPAQLNLPGIDLAGLKDATGILINDRKGAILALHEATRERITSTVVNQADGRDIRQQLDISVTVGNYQQFRDSLRSSILNGRLTAVPR